MHLHDSVGHNRVRRWNMDPRSRELFTTSIARRAARAFGLTPDSLVDLGGFENFVFAAEHSQGPTILRISHEIHRSATQIEAELHWMDHLATGGVALAQALASPTGARVETMQGADGSAFFATVFRRAPGRACVRQQGSPGRVPRAVPAAMGRWLGRSHRVTQSYTPGPAGPRPHGCVDERVIESWIAADQGPVLDRLRALRREISSWSQPEQAYGLIHCDLHPGNFHVADGALTAFDFDDCQYGHFIRDIAISVFAGLEIDPNCGDRQQLNQAYYDELMAGYAEESSLSREWAQRLPVFLAHRELVLFIINGYCQSPSEHSPWWRTFLTQRSHTIATATPLVELRWY